jgi:hypothetical protein
LLPISGFQCGDDDIPQTGTALRQEPFASSRVTRRARLLGLRRVGRPDLANGVVSQYRLTIDHRYKLRRCACKRFAVGPSADSAVHWTCHDA